MSIPPLAFHADDRDTWEQARQEAERLAAGTRWHVYIRHHARHWELWIS